LASLVPYIREIEFFKERDVKEEDFLDIVQCLKYQKINAGDNVFDYGTYGDKFYIIIHGSVQVLVLNPRRKTKKDLEASSKLYRTCVLLTKFY
jgi:CRP-like cAMP-binding protein